MSPELHCSRWPRWFFLCVLAASMPVGVFGLFYCLADVLMTMDIPEAPAKMTMDFAIDCGAHAALGMLIGEAMIAAFLYWVRRRESKGGP